MRKLPLTWALVVAAALLLAACGSSTTGESPARNANGCPTSQPAALAAGEKRQIVMTTSMGEITLLVEADLSPIAVGNFVALAECGFYDNVIFHRIAYMQDGIPFVIQGGDPTGTGTGGPGYKIKDEPVVGEYARGVLAMARSAAPDSQGANSSSSWTTGRSHHSRVRERTRSLVRSLRGWTSSMRSRASSATRRTARSSLSRFSAPR